MKSNYSTVWLSALFAFSTIEAPVHADWTRFRGPNGTGIASDSKSVPTTWSDTKNLKWKAPLPGPGSSSPIVSGNRVFITYWTGYAVNPQSPGNMEDLKIHLRCINRETGDTLWDKSVKAKLPEQKFGGMFAQHGYASHTPVTDGERVYAFFGKTGVYAFDMKGNQLWTADVGTGLDQRGWGSASSPVLTDTGLIEDYSLVSLNKATGKELWKANAEGFESTWGTPVVVGKGEEQDVIIGVPGEIWALNAKTGKMRWYVDGITGNSMTSSVIPAGNIIYATGDRGGGSIAVRTGGKGDVNKTHVAWTGKDGGNISTPLIYEGRIYFLKSSIFNCRDAETGKEIFSERISAAALTTADGRSPNGQSGGRSSRRGGFGGADYASPVAAGGMFYQVTRKGETLVLKLGSEFKLVARNKFTSDQSDFSATPSISNGQLFIRSYKNLYCIEE